MNGSRLEQITGIRYDHANEIVRKLAAKNILILRKGFYGFWMSINFNFSQWNQPNINISSDSNDPQQLLPDSIRNTPDDAGKSIDDHPQMSSNNQTSTHSDAVSKQHTSPKTPVHYPAKNAEATPIQTNTSLNTEITEVHITEPQITASDLDKIEQNNHDLIVQRVQLATDEILDAQKNMSQEIFNIVSEQIIELGQQFKDSEEVSQKIIGLNQQVKGLSNLDEKIQSLEEALEKQLYINQQHKLKNIDLENFIKQQFNQLKQQQNNKSSNQEQLEKLVQQHFDKIESQTLLTQQSTQHQAIQELPPYEVDTDLAAYSDVCDSEQDFSETFTAYHHYLEQENLANDTTENSDLATDNLPPPTAPKQDLSLYYTRLKELKNDYHHAKEQYAYYESHFSQIAEEDKITFDQVVKAGERYKTWTNSVNNLNLAHQAITEYVQDSPLN